nr:eukaryotic translation elongation factor 1 epsilon-1 isoform X3 [Salvelinus alpinus]
MMALRELSSLEKSLGLKKPNKYSTQGDKKVPVLHSNNGPALVGLVTIATHLVQEAKRPELLGESAEHKAVVQQWLEYRLTKVDGCHKDNIKTILKRGLVSCVRRGSNRTLEKPLSKTLQCSASRGQTDSVCGSLMRGDMNQD